MQSHRLIHQVVLNKRGCIAWPLGLRHRERKRSQEIKKKYHMSFTLKLNVNFRELKKGHFHYENFSRALK